MKLLRILAIAVAAAAALSSCYWVGNLGSGELQMDLSGLQARAGDTVRVYLLADDLLFSTGGGVPFAAEAPVTSGELRIKIEGLPVGPTYRALVGVGYDSGASWDVYDYGESSPFRVSPTADTEVTIPSMSSYYSTSYASELLGKNLKGVVPTGSNVYTATQTIVYLVDGGTLGVIDQYDLAVDLDAQGVSDRRVLGLSTDAAFLAGSDFLNTDDGIIPFNRGASWTFDTSFSRMLVGNRAIRESGTFLAGADYACFFRRQEGIGGSYVSQVDVSIPANWSWVNLDTPGVRDMVLSQNYAYFATDGGNFALPPAFLQDSTPTLAEHRIPFSAPAEVLSLGFRPSAAGNGGTLSLGTTDGVWEIAATESSGISFGAATQIPETDGERIERIAVYDDPYSDYAAYISRYFLFIRDSGYIYKIPFFAVIPGKATGIAWGSNGNLFVSGTEGMSATTIFSGC